MSLTAISWTMKNALTTIPPGLRGPMYTENRLMVIGRVLVLSTRVGNAVKGEYIVTVFPDDFRAHSEAVILTEVGEQEGYSMAGPPRTYEVGDGLYSKVLEMSDFGGTSEFLDSLYFLVLNGGKDAA